MNETLVITIEIDTYVKNLTEFDEKKLVKDSSKVLQLVYETEVSAMRKLMLLAFVRKVEDLSKINTFYHYNINTLRKNSLFFKHL